MCSLAYDNNDNYGYDEGDAYIQTFAQMIRKSFRAGDIFIRMVGDEFCLVCRQIRQKVLEEKLENLREMFIAQNQKPYEVSSSYGVVVNERQQIPFEEIVKLADERMYQYKKLHKKERR